MCYYSHNQLCSKLEGQWWLGVIDSRRGSIDFPKSTKTPWSLTDLHWFATSSPVPVIPIHVLSLGLMWFSSCHSHTRLQKHTTERKQAGAGLECTLVGFLLVVSDYFCGRWVLLRLPILLSMPSPWASGWHPGS